LFDEQVPCFEQVQKLSLQPLNVIIPITNAVPHIPATISFFMPYLLKWDSAKLPFIIFENIQICPIFSEL
jgi:hypothetical protein